MSPLHTVLYNAILQQDVTLAKDLIELLKSRNELMAKGKDGFIFLQKAIQHCPSLVDDLWTDNLEMMFGQDKNGNTLLHFAILSGDKKIIKRLIEFATQQGVAGVEYINKTNSIGETALHLILNQKQIDFEIITRLVDAGADFWVHDDQGVAPGDLIKNPSFTPPAQNNLKYHYKKLDEQRANLRLTIQYLNKAYDELMPKSHYSTSQIIAGVIPLIFMSGLAAYWGYYQRINFSPTKILLGTGGLLTSIAFYFKPEQVSEKKRDEIINGVRSRLFYRSETVMPATFDYLLSKIKQSNDVRVVRSLLGQMVKDLEEIRADMNVESYCFPRT